MAHRKRRFSPSLIYAGVVGALFIAAAAVFYYVFPNGAGDGAPPESLPYVVDDRPALLAYEDLPTLSDTPSDQLEEGLRTRLETLLQTPFVNNEAYYAGSRPHRPVEPALGPVMRVVSWNIERGLKLDLILSALAGGDAFLDEIDPEDDDLEITREVRREIEAELRILQSADVLVLQEVDWGMKRTGYRSVVEELTRATEMNWAYGVEFVEVDPFYLGIEEFPNADEEDLDELRRQSAVDPSRYKGLHGTAVLSRYPILDAQLSPLRRQAYDWFADELEGAEFLESAKRTATEEVFRTAIGRQVRRGGRTLLVVNLDVPDVDEGVVTVAAAHLESRSEPDDREEQLEEVLASLRSVRNPVILAGDMNTSGQDGTPTSWKHELYQRVGDAEFWARTATKYLTGVGIVFDAVITGVGTIRRANDPTVEDIPVISPNDEEGFFDLLEEFRFDDGHAFDFRGDKSRSLNGKEGTLANSNHRDDKGFAVTFEVDRTAGHSASSSSTGSSSRHTPTILATRRHPIGSRRIADTRWR